MGYHISAYPFLFHALIISAICSIIGPFGGFLASGFKRACKRKASFIQLMFFFSAYQNEPKLCMLQNFGSFIPGHGGVTDRCDCMFLCAAIIHFYYNAFGKSRTESFKKRYINYGFVSISVKEDGTHGLGFCDASHV